MSDEMGLFNFLAKHVVGLSWIDTDTCGNDPKMFIVSGFVISIDEFWFLAVAGHVLKDMSLRFSDGGRQPQLFRLVDSWAGGGTGDGGIPCDFINAPKLQVFDDSQSLDYGLIGLRPMERQLMEAMNVAPLSPLAWTNVPNDCDKYLLLGFPSMLQTEQHVPQGRSVSSVLNVALALAPVEAMDRSDVPEELKQGFPYFHGRVGKQFATGVTKFAELEDINGFSGGPLFGFKRLGDRWKYWLIGIQSGWLKSQRIICACPFSAFGDSVAAEFLRLQQAALAESNAATNEA